MSFGRMVVVYAFVAISVAAGGIAFAQKSPTDPQIAHVAVTAGEIDIKAAQMALKNSKNKDIRDFAAAMVRDHKKVNEQAAVLMRTLLVQPEDNATSKTMAAQARQDRERIRALKGAEFDRAYIEHEVAYHKAVNAQLAETLIPAAKAPELKAFLEQGLALFQAHQKHAEEVAAKLP
jgi:putative membrane protein